MDFKALATRCNIVRRTLPNIVIRTLLTMLDTYIQHCWKHVTLVSQRYEGVCLVCVLETRPLKLWLVFSIQRCWKGGYTPQHLLYVGENVWSKSKHSSNKKKMCNKRHQACVLHVLTLLIQQMFFNNVWTCSRGLRSNLKSFNQPFAFYMRTNFITYYRE